MKKLHQRSMKLAALPCMIALVLTMSGCTFSEINKMQKKAQTDSASAREKMAALSEHKSQAMTWLDRQWINPVPLSRITREKKAIAPDCYITQARKGEITLQELGQRITAVCGLPVIITPDATSATLEGGVTRQMTGTLPTPDENGRLPLNSPGYTSLSASSQPLTLNNLMWQGDINGLLDLMASRSGLYWRMDNGRIVFYPQISHRGLGRMRYHDYVWRSPACLGKYHSWCISRFWFRSTVSSFITCALTFPPEPGRYGLAWKRKPDAAYRRWCRV